MAEKARESGFPFMRRPLRTQKPRLRGMTVALDWARSIADAESYVETVGDIIDHMKLTDHIGLMFRYSPDYIKRKNAIYRKAGIDTLPGGVVFEMAAVQGKVPQLMERVKELGFGAVEVSADCIDFSPAFRRGAIGLGVEQGLKVFTEIGKKSPDKPLDVNEAVDTAKADIDAGADTLDGVTIRRDRDTTAQEPAEVAVVPAQAELALERGATGRTEPLAVDAVAIVRVHRVEDHRRVERLIQIGRAHV